MTRLPYGSAAEFLIGPSKEIQHALKQDRNSGQLKQKSCDSAKGLINDQHSLFTRVFTCGPGDG